MPNHGKLYISVPQLPEYLPEESKGWLEPCLYKLFTCGAITYQGIGHWLLEESAPRKEKLEICSV